MPLITRSRILPSLALLAVCATATVAAADPPKFDTSPWTEDFAALKAGMETRYANLAWFASPQGGVGLPTLEQHTRAALATAESAGEARRIIVDFVTALGDGHFSRMPDDPPAGAAHAEPPKAKLDPGDPETGCAALGYAPRSHAGFSLPFESLPGFKLTANGLTHGFRAGLLPVRQGVTLGLVRIPEFRETGTAWACLAAWRGLVRQHKPIDADAVTEAVQEQWFAAMSATLRDFAARHVAAVVADVGNNSGGDDLSDWLPRLFTSRPVHSARMLVARAPAISAYTEEELTALRKPLPDTAGPEARAAVERAIAGFEADEKALSAQLCDMSWVWREQRPWQPEDPCSRLIDVGSAGGFLAYLPPHSFDVSVAKRVYWPAVADDYIGAWTGPAYAVTDTHTYSAAEQFAASFQNNHIGKTVGEHTAGDGCGFITDLPPLVLPNSRLAFRMPNCVRLRADGTDEVAGVTPDLPVTPLKDESPRARAARIAETIADDATKGR
jgi:hypothetical protein